MVSSSLFKQHIPPSTDQWPQPLIEKSFTSCPIDRHWFNNWLLLSWDLHTAINIRLVTAEPANFWSLYDQLYSVLPSPASYLPSLPYPNSVLPTPLFSPLHFPLLVWLFIFIVFAIPGHPKVRLLVTHGGMNSLMEAVYHGVPVLGIPLFGDQHENMARIKNREMGTYIPPEQLKAENFASTIQHIIENKR